jgi:bifunctional non-homologous end joining protein LigD
VPAFAPMLATSASGRDLSAGWAFEPKLDGWRAVVTCDGIVSVRTRTGRDITTSLPELTAPPPSIAARSAVLDGELVAGAGKPEDFYGIAGRVASRRPAVPLSFVAFDVLFLDGESLCHRSYYERRQLLASLGVCGGSWATVPSFDGEASEVLAACADLGLEGLVAKRAESRYRPGQRSRDWLKLKTPAWREHHAPRRHEHALARSI